MEACYVDILEVHLTFSAFQGVRIDSCIVSLSCLLIFLSGVSRSTPFVSFFYNDIDREIWTARANVFSIVNASTNGLGELVADSQVIAQLAGGQITLGIWNSSTLTILHATCCKSLKHTDGIKYNTEGSREYNLTNN